MADHHKVKSGLVSECILLEHRQCYLMSDGHSNVLTSWGERVYATALESTAKRSGWPVVLTELVYDVGVRSKVFSTELEVVPPSVLRRTVIASTAVANVMLAPSDVVRPVGVEANCRKQATLVSLKAAWQTFDQTANSKPSASELTISASYLIQLVSDDSSMHSFNRTNATCCGR